MGDNGETDVIQARPEIIYTSDLPEGVEVLLAEQYDARKVKLREVGYRQFLAQFGSARAIVACPGDPFDAQLIDSLPAAVGLIASYSTGLDHIDIVATGKRGILVTNAPDVLTDATADIAMLLILGAVRGATAASRLVRDQKWTGWRPAQIFGSDIRGKRLGILGGGRIGAATAQRAQAFGMTLSYHSRRRSNDLDALGAYYAPDLGSFLDSCDVLSLHVPATSETRNMIDAEALAKMRSGSFLINTARGDLIDDNAVISAAQSGHLAGIGLDVFRNEPALDPRYLKLSNAFLLPHIGSATDETRRAMGECVLASLDAFFSER